jgi:hypothetical protein
MEMSFDFVEANLGEAALPHSHYISQPPSSHLPPTSKERAINIGEKYNNKLII